MQTSEIEGQGNVVVQVAGDGNKVVVGSPYLSLTRHANRRLEELPDHTDMDLLRPFTRGIEMLGREDVLAEFRDGWLDHGPAISVRAVVGSAGSGKTRLALELCEQAAAQGWRAGFLTAHELERFQAQQNAAEWGWNAPTLVVIDYAATGSARLAAWLRELSDHRALGNSDAEETPPLRLLLLERQADPKAAGGWWHTVFGGGDDTARAVHRLLDHPEPITLAPLEGDAPRRAVLTAMLGLLGSDLRVPGPDEDAYFDRQLSSLTWGGEPLFLMMAALLASQSNFAAVLGLQRDDLALQVADRELDRIAKFAGARGMDEGFARHMAAVATLRQGLDPDEALSVIGEEKDALGHDGLDRATAKAVLREVLFHPDGRIAALEPDMVGEAVLLRVWDDHEGQGGVAAVSRAAEAARPAVVPVVIRTCQDYAIHGHVAPLTWLDAMGAAAVQDLPMLLELLNALPQHSIILRERTWRLTETAVAALRDLAESHPDAYRPVLAGSLNNLSARLNALGRRQEALAAIEEAVALYRDLAARHPDAYRPDLATSLNNLSNMLSALGRRQEALAAIEEAVALYRDLAARHPDAYRPDLATSLNTLSNMLSALGRREEALAAIEEAVALYRDLAARHPDAYRPDLATSLNNLSNMLSALGRREEALAAIEQAVALYRDLAARHPDAYRPDLATLLGARGSIYSAFDEHEAASRSFAEALKEITPGLLSLPQAHAGLVVALLQDYLKNSEEASLEPSMELLQPILQILIDIGALPDTDT